LVEYVTVFLDLVILTNHTTPKRFSLPWFNQPSARKKKINHLSYSVCCADSQIAYCLNAHGFWFKLVEFGWNRN